MERNVKNKSTSIALEVWDFLKTLLISMAVVFLVSNYIVKPIRVEGSSMYPTLEDGSFGVSNMIGRNMKGIDRFDIVILYVPEKDMYLVKRCIGLPHDTIRYENDVLTVNGQVVEEDYLKTEYRDSFPNAFTVNGDYQNTFEITLGDGEYYCLGDNRPDSLDSRYYGPFKEEQVTSKGVFILWPFTQFGVKTW